MVCGQFQIGHLTTNSGFSVEFSNFVCLLKNGSVWGEVNWGTLKVPQSKFKHFQRSPWQDEIQVLHRTPEAHPIRGLTRRHVLGKGGSLLYIFALLSKVECAHLELCFCTNIRHNECWGSLLSVIDGLLKLLGTNTVLFWEFRTLTNSRSRILSCDFFHTWSKNS